MASRLKRYIRDILTRGRTDFLCKRDGRHKCLPGWDHSFQLMINLSNLGTGWEDYEYKSLKNADVHCESDTEQPVEVYVNKRSSTLRIPAGEVTMTFCDCDSPFSISVYKYAAFFSRGNRRLYPALRRSEPLTIS